MGYRDKHICTKPYLTIYKAIIALHIHETISCNYSTTAPRLDARSKPLHYSTTAPRLDARYKPLHQECRKQIGTKQSTYHVYINHGI